MTEENKINLHLKKNEWRFGLSNPKKGGKISSVIAKNYESAKKQIDVRFPPDQGWIVRNYVNPSGFMTEFHY